MCLSSALTQYPSLWSHHHKRVDDDATSTLQIHLEERADLVSRRRGMTTLREATKHLACPTRQIELDVASRSGPGRLKYQTENALSSKAKRRFSMKFYAKSKRDYGDTPAVVPRSCTFDGITSSSLSSQIWQRPTERLRERREKSRLQAKNLTLKA